MSPRPNSICSIAILLIGCSTPPLDPNVPEGPSLSSYKTVVYTGRVISRIQLPASKTLGTATTNFISYGRGMFLTKGATRGTLLLDAYYIYDIDVAGNTTNRVRVAAIADIPAGTCVDVMTQEATPPGKTTFPGSEAALLPSMGCAK